jgi:hypothetical protein
MVNNQSISSVDPFIRGNCPLEFEGTVAKHMRGGKSSESEENVISYIFSEMEKQTNP